MRRVYYTGVISPIGTIWAAATEAGLLQVNLPRPEAAFVESVKRRVKADVVNDPYRFDTFRRMLEAYFDGRRVAFELPLDLRGTEFQKAVWRAISRIPYGRLSSYGRLAVEVGRPRAARAVGNAVGANPLAIVVPCHRVIRSDGSIGGFGGGPDLKRHLLRIEGVLSQADDIESPETRAGLRHFFE